MIRKYAYDLRLMSIECDTSCIISNSQPNLQAITHLIYILIGIRECFAFAKVCALSNITKKN